MKRSVLLTTAFLSVAFASAAAVVTSHAKVAPIPNKLSSTDLWHRRAWIKDASRLQSECEQGTAKLNAEAKDFLKPYALGPNDKIDEEGNITRGAVEAPKPPAKAK